MAFRLTNAHLGELLTALGFESGDLVKNNHRSWRHPDSGCTLLLPVNKTHDAPRPADLVGLKAQLDYQGHLDARTFELFVTEGRLPSTIAERG